MSGHVRVQVFPVNFLVFRSLRVVLDILAFSSEKSERTEFRFDESASNMWTCFKNQLKQECIPVGCVPAEW